MNHQSINNTTVMLLAAGHGKRMLPLTQHTPKALLRVGERSLIEHHLHRLQQQGFKNVVINLAYLGEQIRAKLGDGSQFNLQITYSDETNTGALETAGGIRHAMPLIDSDPFLVINADIATDINFASLVSPLHRAGRLVLVDNPVHNQNGDFELLPSQLLGLNQGINAKTFSGVALYQKRAFTSLEKGKCALAPVFRQLIRDDDLEGVLHQGQWTDVGTPERLAQLNQQAD